MTALKGALRQSLRGRTVSGLLERLGIDPRRYWILVDLFHKLKKRREAVQQMGGIALRVAYGILVTLSILISLVNWSMDAPVADHLSLFLISTLFVLAMFLLPETADSLVNPVEGMILAHQPVNGATYTSAKLTHLLRIVFYIVLGMNGVPALIGTLLDGAAWFYAPLHLTAAFASSIILALIFCSFFGWLIRFVPVRRLKGIAVFAQGLPILAIAGAGPLRNLVRDTLPAVSDFIFRDIVVGGVLGAGWRNGRSVREFRRSRPASLFLRPALALGRLSDSGHRDGPQWLGSEDAPTSFSGWRLGGSLQWRSGGPRGFRVRRQPDLA